MMQVASAIRHHIAGPLGTRQRWITLEDGFGLDPHGIYILQSNTNTGIYIDSKTNTNVDGCFAYFNIRRPFLITLFVW